MKRTGAFLLLFIILSGKTYGHGDEFYTTYSAFGMYDTKQGGFLPAFDVNACLLVLNAGVNYKLNPCADAKKLTFYAGVGILNVAQLQAGIFKGGFSLRNRYELPIGYLLSESDLPDIVKCITVSAIVERCFLDPNMKWYFGAGLGLSFHHLFWSNYW
jgi:hypothetical protein